MSASPRGSPHRPLADSAPSTAGSRVLVATILDVEHHDVHCSGRPVLHRNRPGARFAVTLGNRQSRPVSRLDAHSAHLPWWVRHGTRPPKGSFISSAWPVRTSFSIPMLRIVPDDTKFDFMRFSPHQLFRPSAIFSIVAILPLISSSDDFGIDLHRRHV